MEKLRSAERALACSGYFNCDPVHILMAERAATIVRYREMVGRTTGGGRLVADRRGLASGLGALGVHSTRRAGRYAYLLFAQYEVRGLVFPPMYVVLSATLSMNLR